MTRAEPKGAEALTLDDLFQAHAPYVWRALRRLGVAEDDVEDVCQEVFMTVHRRLNDFEGRSTLKTWIYGICTRTASDHRRRARRRQEREVTTDAIPEGAVSATQEEDLHRRRALARLDEALATLDDDKRAVFVLYEIEGLTMPEVAEALSCPTQTAYSRLHAARRRVRKQMTPLQTRGAL